MYLVMLMSLYSSSINFMPLGVTAELTFTDVVTASFGRFGFGALDIGTAPALSAVAPCFEGEEMPFCSCAD